jgi:hypothetical protein
MDARPVDPPNLFLLRHLTPTEEAAELQDPSEATGARRAAPASPGARGSVLHQQALTVLGFFTGFALTSLVLILTSPASFRVPIGPLSGAQYFQLVATYVAVTGAVSSVGILAFLEVAGGMAAVFSRLDQFATILYLTAVFAFMGILPLLLSPFTHVGAAGVLGAEAFLLAAYFVVRRL